MEDFNVKVQEATNLMKTKAITYATKCNSETTRAKQPFAGETSKQRENMCNMITEHLAHVHICTRKT